MPLMPTAYSTVIEANILEKDYSIELLTYYDYGSSSMRTDAFKNDQIVSTYQVGGNRYYGAIQTRF